MFNLFLPFDYIFQKIEKKNLISFEPCNIIPKKLAVVEYSLAL